MSRTARPAATAVAALIALSVPYAFPQEFTIEVATDPSDARFVYTDLHNFIHAHKMLAAGGDTLSILQTEYLDKGTPGLKMFIEKYDLTSESLHEAIRKRPEKYASLGDLLGPLATLEDSARAAFSRLKLYIPDAVFPPTYFLVERHWGIGSGSVEGQLIAVDKWVPPLDGKNTMLVHELVHFQQGRAIGYEKYKALFDPERNLLGLCIREGTAEFFADLVTGEITQNEAVDYVLQNEKRLWDRFAEEMHGRETGDWMWAKPADPDQPRHVGYVIGCRIVESYYMGAADKEQAVAEILSVTDYPAFLEQSRYAARFAAEADGGSP